MSQVIRLTISTPDGPSREQVFQADTILIGSGPSAVLRIEHADVSTLHAVVKVTPSGEVTIVDLGSETGTQVNGQAISEPVIIASGDEISLGQVRIGVALGPQAARVTTPDRTELPPMRDSAPPLSQDLLPKPAPAEPLKPQAAPKQKDETQVIREKSSQAHPIRPEDEVDLSLLETALNPQNHPTSDEHALQISAFWGMNMIDAVQVRAPRPVTVAPLSGKKAADLMVEADLPADSFAIAKNRGQEATIVVPSGAKVALRDKSGAIKTGNQVQLGAGAKAPFPASGFNLGFGERLAFKVGTLTFVAEYVRGDAELGKGKGMDWYFPRVFAISALLHVFFVVAAFITPKVTSTLTDDLFKNDNRFAQMILKAPEKEKKRKKLDLSGSKGGAKHRGEEGKFGKKDLPKKDALASKAGAPRVDPNKREKDRKIAMNSGLLGILKGGAGSGAVSNVFGPGGLGTGINNAMGGLRGSAMGDAGGAGGLGTRGTGAGGGGNSLGIGGLGTHGHGRGTGGYGNIDLGGRGKGTTRVVPGRTIIKGSLSREEIGRVIRRNLARFKYCYEKQLNANPNLAGKISVYFTIAPTGAVAKASIRETSMNDNNVEGCVTKVMRSLKFPRPRGGGIVVVTYPFVFAAK